MGNAGRNLVTRQEALLRKVRRLDLNSLRLYSIVCQRGSIASASLLEPLTASAISKRIRELEEVFGAELLVRTRNGVQPTDLGRTVLDRWSTIDELVTNMLDFENGGRNESEEQSYIVADAVASRFLVFDRLGQLPFAAQAGQVAVVESPALWLPVRFGEMRAGMAVWNSAVGDANATDGDPLLVAGAFPDAGEVHSSQVPFYTAVVRHDHPLATGGAVTSAGLAEFPLALVGGAEGLAASIERSSGRGRCIFAQETWARHLLNALDFLEVAPNPTVLLAPSSATLRLHRYRELVALSIDDVWATQNFNWVLRRDAPSMLRSLAHAIFAGTSTRSVSA